MRHRIVSSLCDLRSSIYDPRSYEAVLISLAAMFLMVATLGDSGMAWDEGYTVQREELVQRWFRLAWSGSRAAWQRETVHRLWPFSREEPDGHPPFYALVGLAGWLAVHRTLPPLEAYRFGPAALFSGTLGVVYWLMARSYGRLGGMTAALALLTMPRVFAHAHLASYDVPTLCLWFLSVAAFLKAVEGRSGIEKRNDEARAPFSMIRSSIPDLRSSIFFGLAAGCAASTKFTGWFLPVPLLVWTALYRDRRALRTLLIGGAVAVGAMYVLNPTWWHDPLGGVAVFLRSNLTRRETRPVPIWFFGRYYPFALPWYNTLAWTAIVVPPATLALALLGIGRVLRGRFRDRSGTLILGCWAFFMILRALPNAPGHDGVRQFLAAFAFLACLAGIGAAALPEIFHCLSRRWLGEDTGKRVYRVPPKLQRLVPTFGAGVVVVSSLCGGAYSTWRYHPLQLSYYNGLIGGLSGATRAGMEPTYYWDAVTPDVRAWLNTHTPAGRTIQFSNTIPTFAYLHRWGLLKPSPMPDDFRLPRWYILQNRPGILHDPALGLDLLLLERYRPAFAKSLDVAPEVPLVAIYSIDDVLRALRER